MDQAAITRRALGLLAVVACLVLAACGGGDGGPDPLQPLRPVEGPILILNNTPAAIERIELGWAGDGAPKQDYLQGTLLSGSSVTLHAIEGVYDIDVFIAGQPVGVLKQYTDVVVTSSALATIAVVP